MKKDYTKLLISSSCGDTIKDSVKLATELGTGIEISRLPIYKTPNQTVDDAVAILKDDLGDFANRITLHAMFSDVNVAGKDYMLKQIAQLRFQQSFEVGKKLNVDTILFHTGNKGTKHYGSIANFKKNFIAYWKDFIQQFEENNIIAVLENVFETNPEFCLELFEKIDSPNLKLALDVGHVNLYAHDTVVEDWLKAYGSNLYHMHLHNNFRENDDHSNFENGTLNFRELLTTIKNSNIHPSFVMEMYSKEDVIKSVKLFREVMN